MVTLGDKERPPSMDEAPQAYRGVANMVRVVEGARMVRQVAPMRPIGVVKG